MVVQSIVWQALRTSPDAKAIQGVAEARLFALSRSHDLLNSKNWKSAGLLDLLNAALEPFVDGRPGRIVITGENIDFPPRAALALSIAFNELATNAVKYGALSNDFRINPDRVEDRPDGGGSPGKLALAGEGRPARNATLT